MYLRWLWLAWRNPDPFGTLNLHWTATLAAVLAVAMVVFTFAGGHRAWAQDGHHHRYHGVYEHWKQPIESKAGCCNARFNEQGEEVGDCEATSFELRKTADGLQWYAFVPMIQRTILVPENKIIKEKNPDPTGRSGHICYSVVNGVLCAVPPTGGV